MECIACTACVDACDEVMAKTKKPAGLIRYTTLAQLRGKPRVILKPRALVYAALFLLCAGLLTFFLGSKDFLEVAVLRAQGAPYELVTGAAGPEVVNHFRLELSNQTGVEHQLALSLADDLQAAGVTLIMPMNPLTLKVGAAQRADFFLRFPQKAVPGARKGLLQWESDGMKRTLEVTLVGPGA